MVSVRAPEKGESYNSDMSWRHETPENYTAIRTMETPTIALLESYAEEANVGSTEKTLARVAARWIAAEPAAAESPLLTDLLQRAQTHKALHNGTDTLLFAPRPATPLTGRRANILDYFTSSVLPRTKTAAAPITSPSVDILDIMPVSRAPTRFRIYCDGACTANGRRGAKAGFGAVLQTYTGEDVETVSQPLDPTEPQTNQRAELRALQWSIAKALSDTCAAADGTDIHTDSEYAMKCLTEWGPLWAAKSWRKANGGEVLHQDILRPMWDMWKKRGSRVRLYHVAAHTGRSDQHSKGNARADALATASIASN